ncbi:cyclic di-AMP binding protein CbpA [Lacticaseibacillus hulanensis]|jgi:CBS domain containing-hemolysin-like protein|uniref:cyclic di-AMP binding protein CbpA n=1 Tax=Lacticaseibacillus hulanensis TaxID=2493111 RepID=UPI000FDBE206|nr:cyclic di-AMP binding protein CbpA [Lacticaseibacillus hulanensis]
MLIKSLVTKKEFLTTVKETVTLEEALAILEESGYRCVPILDETGKIFRGNIYKMHIYRHKSQGGDMSLPVTYLLKNATKTIPVNAPFFKVFFNIKDLPYIAVLDESANFYGILTHTQLLNMLSDAWNIDVGSYVLTVMSTGEQGDLAAMSKILAKYVSIAACVTLDAGKGEYVRRTLFTLPAGTDESTLNLCVTKLEKKHFRVVEIDDLQSGQPVRSDEL